MVHWDERYSVGVEKIDRQHETFFGLINRLEDLTHHDHFRDELPRLLNEIVEYASLHFKTEEAIMNEVGYDGIESHHENHESIKTDIYHECKKVVEKEATAMDIIWLYNYMNNWLKHHILEVDMLYIEAFKAYKL
jgi:hemerythrin